jgi:hypothetical protein
MFAALQRPAGLAGVLVVTGTLVGILASRLGWYGGRRLGVASGRRRVVLALERDFMMWGLGMT